MTNPDRADEKPGAEPAVSSKDPKNTHVYLHIDVRRKNRGYAYRARARVDSGEPINLEGWYGGSEKEVRKAVQNRVEKILTDRRKRDRIVNAPEVQSSPEPLEQPVNPVDSSEPAA